MAIPKHILENNIIKPEIISKEELKVSIEYIISFVLKSKRILETNHNTLYQTHLDIFINLIDDYNFYEHRPFTIRDSMFRRNFLEKTINSSSNFSSDEWESLSKIYKDWYKWFIDYANFIDQPNIQNFGKTLFEFALKYFSISNFQCIKHIEAQLPVDAQFIVFTGENGDGKTAILQALGLGFYNTKDLTDNEKGNIETSIIVQYKANEDSYHNEIYNDSDYPILYSLRHHIEEIKPFAAYGAARLTISEKRELQNPLLNLISDKAKLYDVTETWLRDIAANEPEKYKAVCDILVSLLPNVSEIRKVNPNKVISDLVFIEKGVPMELKNLSAGHKSIVLMIGDMIMRLSSAQPEITNPKDFAGIVLIDELETHLHPKWQKEFPKILAETFPKVQFIVTTHSAITLLGMPKNTVFFKVTRTEEEGTQIERLEIDVENLTPNLLLSSPIFGLQDIFSVQNKGMENVHTGNFFDEKDTRQQAKDKIRALYKQLKDKENNEKNN